MDYEPPRARRARRGPPPSARIESMQFQLNGEMQQAEEPLDLRSLLERFDLQERRVAVAVNAEVVPRSRFEAVEIRDGDRVEVIQAVGGG